MTTLVCGSTPLAAQSGQANVEPDQQVIYRIDSAAIQTPNVSADKRWIAFWMGSSLWMARVPDGKPVRLTPAGMYATWPVFSPTGNAVFFVGDRPGTNDAYVMAVPVNLETGAVTGQFRQVSTDKIAFPGRAIRAVSWDGKLVAYNSSPQTLRLVSANGGNPRTIGNGGGTLTPAAFSRDNRFVYYTERHADGSTAIDKVSVDGGAPERVVSAAGNAIALAYRPERAYFVTHPDTGAHGGVHAELFDYSGRLIAKRNFPMPGGWIRADGRGTAWVKSTVRYTTGKIDLRTRISTRIAGPAVADPQALLSDGTIATVKREPSGQLTVGVEDTIHPVSHGHITLPVAIRQIRRTIPGDKFLFGTGAPNNTGVASLYIIDPRSGATRPMQPASGSFCPASGSDTHTCLARREAGAVQIESIDPDGKVSTARSFPSAEYENLWGLDVSGAAGAHRVAYMLPNARHDSLNVFVADAPNGAPCAVGAVALPSGAKAPWWELTISPRTDRVAVIALPPGQSAYRAMFFPVPAPGTCQAHHPVALDIGLNDLDEYMWLPDGSGLVLAGTSANSQGNALVFRPVSDVPPSVLLPDNGVYKDLVGVSGDSRTLFYAEEVPKGSVVYTAEVFPTIK